MQLPVAVRCTKLPVIVHFPEVLKFIVKPDVAVAVMVKSGSVTMWSGIIGKVIVWFAFAILNACVTGVAGLYVAFPAWEATIEHEPAPVMWTRFPLTVQLPVALNVTCRPDDAIAAIVKSGFPYVLFGRGPKVMV